MWRARIQTKHFDLRAYSFLLFHSGTMLPPLTNKAKHLSHISWMRNLRGDLQPLCRVHEHCKRKDGIAVWEGSRHSLLPSFWDLRSFRAMPVVCCLMAVNSFHSGVQASLPIMHPSLSRSGPLESGPGLWLTVTNTLLPSLNEAHRPPNKGADLAYWKKRGQ